MKKIITAACFIAFSFLSANAQEDTRIGAFLGYGSEIKTLGLGVNAEFLIMENLTIAPNFTYFLPKEESSIVKTTIFELNANANYYFLNDDTFGVYGLAGLNYTSVKVKVEDFGFGGASSSEGKVGFNLGAGTNFNLGKSWTPFAELKYVLSDYDQLVLLAGVKFNL